MSSWKGTGGATDGGVGPPQETRPGRDSSIVSPTRTTPSRHEYRLTPKGRDLNDLLLVLAHWGDRWLDNGAGPPITYLHTECGHEANIKVACTSCGEAMSARTTTAVPGPGFPKHLPDVTTDQSARSGS